MFELCLRWSILAMDVSLKALLLAVVTGCGIWLLRVRRSDLKHAAWLGVLAGMIGLPWLSLVLPAIPLPILLRPETAPATPFIASNTHASPMVGFDAQARGDFRLPDQTTENLAGPRWQVSRTDPRTVSPTDRDVTGSTSSEESAASSMPSSSGRFVVSAWPVIAFTVWGWGVLAFGTKLLLALLVTRQLLQRSTSIAAEIHPRLKDVAEATRSGWQAMNTWTNVGMRESADVSVPLTAGVLHPHILLPTDWRTWPAEKLRDVLVHEYTHIRRRDGWTALAAEVMTTVYWFHPLSWWLRRRLAALAEDCCDDAAIGAAGDRAVYARHLLEIASMLCQERRRLHYVGLSMARRYNVERRILSILDGKRPLSQPLTRSVALLLVAVILPVVSVAAALKPAEESSTDNDSPTKSKAAPPPSKKAEGSPRNQATPTPGAASRATDSNDAAPAASAAIKLDPGVVIGGIVRGEEGEPIANARVKIGLWGDGQNHEVDVRTGADGRWRAHVPEKARANRFLLYHADYVCVPISHATPPEEPLHAQEAVSVMKRGKHVHGKVHDQRGKPIANALVVTQPYNVDLDQPDDDLTTTRTRDDGSFAVRNMADGPGGLAVYADGYAPEMVAVNVNDATAAVDIELSSAGELSGQIVDETGQGVSGVWIQAWQWQPEPSFPLDRQTQTDREGRFRLTQLPRHGWFQLNYEKEGFLQIERHEVHAANEPCTLRIARPTTFRGQVLDDETGEPIKKFTVIKGTRWSRQDDMVFDHGYDDRKEAIDNDEGHFEVALNHTVAMPPFPQVAIRVVARGYLPEQTEPVSAGDQPAAVTLRLKRAEPITGLVIDSTGQPAAHAQVAWVGPKRNAIIENGRLWEHITYRPEIIQQTDDAGRFELPASRDDGLIVLLHARGYAERRHSKHDAGSPLRLTEWCSVEGRVLAGRKPIANVTVGLTPVDPKLNTQDSEVRWVIRQQTHVDGSFAFDFVPSIPLTATWYRTLSSHKTEVKPVAGETVRVEIGGNGRAVIGQLKKPGGLKMESFTDAFEVGIHCTQVVAYPAEEAGMKKDVRHNFVAELKSYGMFTVHDLPSGRYLLEANVHAPVPPESCGLPVTIAAARTEFEVAGGASDAPIQLGPLSLKRTPGPEVGQVIPDLKATTLTGEPFDLAKLRGRPVLLDFWATWCGPCKAALPELKRLYETYGRGGAIAFVGIDLDYTVETAADYVAEKGIAWPHVATGSWGEENAVAREFAVTSVPSFWLIGADGTILARDVPLAELPKQIEAAIKMSNLPQQRKEDRTKSRPFR